MATHYKVTDDREPSTVVARETGKGRLQQEVISGAHRLLADEPIKGWVGLIAARIRTSSCSRRWVQARRDADRKQLPLTLWQQER